jgi:hypothetical protein
MAKQRPSSQKRDREFRKRDRERRKREKAALKRARREGNRDAVAAPPQDHETAHESPDHSDGGEGEPNPELTA